MSGTFWSIEQVEPIIKERNDLRQRVEELEERQWQGMDDDLAEVSAAIRHTIWMEPPDGGSPSLAEQVKRMRNDAERYRWLREESFLLDAPSGLELLYGEKADIAIDAAMKTGEPL